MDAAAGQVRHAPSLLEGGYGWFHRVIAFYCLLFGLLYWVRLVGYYPGQLWRFDLMPTHWQVACVILAVLYPLAASGLWMVASWGPVIWIICAATETVMYAGFPELYGERAGVVMTHAATILLFAGFRAAIHVEHLRARRREV